MVLTPEQNEIFSLYDLSNCTHDTAVADILSIIVAFFISAIQIRLSSSNPDDPNLQLYLISMYFKVGACFIILHQLRIILKQKPTICSV
jgi:hypothetical protein